MTDPHSRTSPVATPRRPARGQRVAGWTSRDALRVLALGFALYYGLQLAWTTSHFLLVGFLGILFGIALASGVDRLHARGVPRGVAAGGIVLALYGVLVGAGVWLAPTLRQQGAALQEQLPRALDRVDAWLEARGDGVLGTLLDGDSTASPVAGTAPGAADSATAARPPSAANTPAAEEEGSISVRERIAAQLRGSAQYIRPVLSGTASALAAFLLVTFVAIYLAVEPRVYKRGLMHLLPHSARERADEVLSATGVVLRKWLVTQLVAMVAIGAVSTGVLLALGVEAAFALGVLAGLFEFIPIAGPIISAVPAIGMAFLASPQTALYVTIAYVVIQQLESQVLTPLLMKQGLEIPPIVTIVAQGIMALLFGFVGLLVAVPLVAAVIVPVKMLYVRDVVGDDVSVVGEDEDSSDDS